jgi:hypothetical protein
VHIRRVLVRNRQPGLRLPFLEDPLHCAGGVGQAQHGHHVEVDHVKDLGGLVPRDGRRKLPVGADLDTVEAWKCFRKAGRQLELGGLVENVGLISIKSPLRPNQT